jgi:hypothetical protein
VRRRTEALVRGVQDGTAVLADRWTGAESRIPCAVLVEAGPARPGDVPPGDAVKGGIAAGDAVAPRTVLQAVLEGRRAAFAVLSRPS